MTANQDVVSKYESGVLPMIRERVIYTKGMGFFVIAL